MKTNTITVNIPEGKERVMAPALRWEYDLAQYLKIEGLQLPEYYQVDFCNVGDEETITMVGTEDGVLIPDQLIQTGLPIAAYLYLQTGTESWNTEIMILISVMGRPERTDIEPTPEEQSTIDSLLAAMNEAVADGVGIPAGGTAGQVLTKESGDDYDAGWHDAPDGESLFIVNGTWYSIYYYNLDHTFAEIKAAYQAGKYPMLKIGSDLIPMVYMSDETITFRRFFADISSAKGTNYYVYASSPSDPTQASYYDTNLIPTAEGLGLTPFQNGCAFEIIEDSDDPESWQVLRTNFGMDISEMNFSNETTHVELFCNGTFEWGQDVYPELRPFPLVDMAMEDYNGGILVHLTFGKVEKVSGTLKYKEFKIDTVAYTYDWTQATVTYTETAL